MFEQPSFSANTLPRRPLTFSHGRGAEFWDTAGRRYLDLSAQTLNLLFGHVHPHVHDLVARALARGSFITQDFLNEQQATAMRKLHALLPPHLTRFNMRMCDASSAVESAVKQARRATGRPKVMTSAGIYLGQNMQNIHMRGAIPKPMDLLVGGHEDVIFAPTSFDPQTGARVPLSLVTEQAVALVRQHASELACVLLDPILISCGALMTSEFASYLHAVQAACGQHGVPFALDESQTFGWVQHHTLAAEYGLSPDLLVLGKGVAAGFPLAICASTPAFDNLAFCEADYTHGGHMITMAALEACCDLVASEGAAFTTLRDHLAACVDELVSRRPAFVGQRANGLVFSVQLKLRGTPADIRMFARQISDRCLERGVYIRNYWNSLVVKAPRAISAAQLSEAFAILAEVIDQAIEAPECRNGWEAYATDSL